MRHRLARPQPAIGVQPAANFDHLAFTDDDCRVTPEWLQQFTRGFAQTGCDALGGSTGNPQPNNMAMQASQFLIEFMYGYMQDGANNNLMLVSNNVAYRRRRLRPFAASMNRFPWLLGKIWSWVSVW